MKRVTIEYFCDGANDCLASYKGMDIDHVSLPQLEGKVWDGCQEVGWWVSQNWWSDGSDKHLCPVCRRGE